MAIRLIVGLGNPGGKYLQTRHNAGFWFIDALSSQYHASLQAAPRFKAESGDFPVAGGKCFLLKPLTFMNASGEALQAFSHYYKIKAEEILVAHDELDLPPGTIRLKKAGGHGGHNGLRSIISHLGSKDFWRLRIGIGHPGSKHKVIDYVLGKITRQDQQLVDDALQEAVNHLELLLSEQQERFMHIIHSKHDNR